MSLTTDITIINSFKDEAREKGVGRVTIGSVADRCGCARQTIYYHFRGTMDLLKWITQNEMAELSYDALNKNRWKKEMFRLLCTIKTNDWLFKDIYNSKYWGEYHEFLMEVVQMRVVETFFYNCSTSGSSKNRENLVRIFTYSFVGQIIDWMKSGFKDAPEDMMKDIERLCGATFHKLIEDYLVLRPQGNPALVN